MGTRWLLVLMSVMAASAVPRMACGIAGTDHVASPGQPVDEQVAESYGWPDGTLDLVNDPLRRNGWLPWFSGCPNDVQYFEFEVLNSDDVNRLIRLLAKVKRSPGPVNYQAFRPLIRLSVDSEMQPVGAGGVPKLGNNVGAVFSIGSQNRLNEWFKQLPGGKFGVHQYEHPPEAVPPTLTLYVRHPAIDLAKLRIPAAVEVRPQYELSAKAVEQAKAQGIKADPVAEELRPTVEAINQFITESKTQSTPLREAIERYNRMAREDVLGHEQPPLTQQEVVAVIRFLNRNEVRDVSDEQFQIFKNITETRELPPGADFEVLRGWDPGKDFLFEGWSVRLIFLNPDGGTHGFPIRTRMMRSIPLEDEIERLKKVLADNQPGPGTYRIENRVKELEQRLVKKRQRDGKPQD
jgi:hypothetical protein